MTTYTPSPAWPLVGNALCASCGQCQASHHSDGRCYTPEEFAHRARFAQRTGRCPGPDEGCEPETGDQP